MLTKLQEKPGSKMKLSYCRNEIDNCKYDFASSDDYKIPFWNSDNYLKKLKCKSTEPEYMWRPNPTGRHDLNLFFNLFPSEKI